MSTPDEDGLGFVPAAPAKARHEDDGLGFTPAAPTPRETPSTLEAAGRGLAQGGTFGFSDELSGVLQAMGDNALRNVDRIRNGEWEVQSPSAEWERFKKAYKENRDASRREDKAAHDAHSTAYNLADFAGGMATGAVLPVGKASAVVQGAVSGLGHSEADSVAGDAAQTALGGALGRAGHFLGDKVGAAAGRFLPRAAQALQDKADDFAAERAVKAAGPMLKDVRNIGTIQDVRALGSELLDRGVVQAGDNAEQVAEKAMAQVKAASAQWSKALQDLDATTGARFNPAQAALRIEREVLAPLRGKPVFQEVVKQLEEQNARLWELGERRGGMGFSEADELKRSYDQFVNWTREQTPYREALKQFRGILRDEIDTAAEKAAKSSGTDAAERFLFAKDTFKKFLPLSDAAEDFTLRTLKNRFTSPSDYGVGTGTALLSNMSGANPLASMALGGAASLIHKVARERGSSTLAVAADKVAGSAWLQKAVNANPAPFGKYGALLATAAARGTDALAQAHYVLSQTDPDYAAQVQQAAKQGQQ